MYMMETKAYCTPKLNEQHPCHAYSNNRFDSLVGVIDLYAEQVLPYKSEQCEVLLLISGSIMLHMAEDDEIVISEKQLFLLPPGYEISIQGLDASQLIVCKLTEDVKLYVRNETPEQFKPTGPIDRAIYILPFRPPIAKFAESLTMSMKNGLCCETYLGCKLIELMFLLRTYYPEQEQAKLFQLLMHERSDFQIKISKIEGEVKTAKEMAAKCHMTEVGFRKRFKQEMGIPPGEYLIERKKRLLAKDLRLGIKNNNDLCYEYGFNSASGLTNFCRMHLGGTPSELRKGTELTSNKSQRHIKRTLKSEKSKEVSNT